MWDDPLLAESLGKYAMYILVTKGLACVPHKLYSGLISDLKMRQMFVSYQLCFIATYL